MSTETPEFTVEWNDKTQDFLLSVGIPVTKLSDEIIEKITTCKGEYIPHKKRFLIPHAKLCILLDECFDYFSEESLVHIAKLLDKSNSDANGIRLKEHTEEKIREKSVSKSKQMFSKKIEPPKTTKTAIELFNDKIKETTFATPLVEEESSEKEDIYRSKRDERYQSKKEDKYREKREERHYGKKDDKYIDKREDRHQEKREDRHQEKREDRHQEKREEKHEEKREDRHPEKREDKHEEKREDKRDDKYQEKREERYRERRERKYREKREDDKLLKDVNSSKDTMTKQVLLDYVANLRHRMEKIEKYIKKM